MNGITTLESTAIRPAHPAPPIYGRGGFLLDDPQRRKARGHAGDQTPNADSADAADFTDATGLSRRPDAVATALEALRREQAATAHERAYTAAGRRAPEHNDGAASTSLITASPSGLADTAAREADAQDLRTASGNQIRPDRAEPGQSGVAADQGGQSVAASGGAEARSAERTFLGNGADSERADPREASGTAGQSAEEALTDEERLEVEDLKARDREVRTHEQAHLAAGGSLITGGPHFQRERGPDGRMYAVAGEVQIDTSEGANPGDTIAKARRIRAAALAPAQPSPQDRQVAAEAVRMEASAWLEKASEDDDASAPGAARTDDEADDRQDANPALLLKASQAYARASGSALPALWGSGISLSV